MSRLHEPLTLPVHPELLEAVNNMSIAIKANHIDFPEKKEKPEAYAKLQKEYPAPTWEEVERLLMKCYHAINEQRKDPRRY